MGPYWQLTVCVELPGGTWKSLSLFIFHHCLLFSSWRHTCKGKKTLTKFFFCPTYVQFHKERIQDSNLSGNYFFFFHFSTLIFFGSQIQNSNWLFLFVQAQNECAYWLSDGCQLQCIQVKLLTEDVRWSEATHLIRHFHVMHCAHVWSFSFVTAE